MSDLDLSPLADESLRTFEEIEQTAKLKLKAEAADVANSFATTNTLTGGQAITNLTNVRSSERESLQQLCEEPAILRIILESKGGQEQVLYIGRNGNVPLPSKTDFASYRSPLGRAAEIPPGDEVTIPIQGELRQFYVIEKTSYNPKNSPEGWDSIDCVYRHYDKGTYSIQSLRALLKETFPDADELDQLLEQAEADGGVVAGIRHQVRTAMGLRDQPILDKFQGEIFRLPLNSQLIILGPPGTGKTTTLIKRLGQKLDLQSLDEVERRIAEKTSEQRPHERSWLMFSPSELLKHYLKEAFNREQVPASDDHIRTWASFRHDIARNTLELLRSANVGRFTFKADQEPLAPDVIANAENWFQAFQDFHEGRLRQQLLDGVKIVEAAASDSEQAALIQLNELKDKISNGALIEVYRNLESAENNFKEMLSETKAVADELLKKERNLLYNREKDIFNQIAVLIESLEQDSEEDEDDRFDEDEQEEASTPSHTSIQLAVNAYLSAIKALARTKYLKRSMRKTSRAAAVIDFLGERIPSEAVLLEIGRNISFQNGLRRFINSHRRFVKEAAASYAQFRRRKEITENFYLELPVNRTHISSSELDGVILLILKNARLLLGQSFVSRAIDEPRFSYLANISEMFRNQIMVDEATDFSMLELACMANLTSIESQSFFACGDFNQRITNNGARNESQLKWAVPSYESKTVQTVYRQSRKLNEFAESLLRLQGGDLSTLGKVPKESTHDGVSPVLRENASEEEYAAWIANRIKEVEKSVQQLPTIAVLVNSEAQVRPMAEKLSEQLEDINLIAVACEEGKALGEGTDVRVFDIQHIKGLEFEAVFFAGVDQLAAGKPDLFDRFLYVGATRAATYLGFVCQSDWPQQLEPLRSLCNSNWDV